MFESVLVANRGEIAVRVLRTLRIQGIRSIAVYSDADAAARHVREADEAVRIGPAPVAESYLSIEAVLHAARSQRAAAIHPGYGFLSENPAFARACHEAGIVFVGPPPAAIEAMGDKIAAKTRIAAAGVPVVPGRHDPAMSDDDVAAAVAEVGFPALLKPSAGGGGKGMRVVRAGDDVSAAIAAARREASKAFGDGRLLVERYIERPRHIEVQVLADQHGWVLPLGERECSLQRRHQKVIEEAPSPFVTPPMRDRLEAAAVRVARSCGYQGAGTVEFIVDGKDPDSFYFLEMNTRLQVEHPVTELVTGLDLVEQQLLIAAGEPLARLEGAVTLRGHSIEARVYAEDPGRDFLPSTGTLLAVHEPTEDVRVDSGVRAGQVVTADYDPLLAKVVVHGSDRLDAFERLQGALRNTSYLGVTTNVGFLARLAALPQVVAGDLHTGLIEELPDIAAPVPPDDHEIATAALEWQLSRQPGTGADAWAVPDGWRPHGRAASVIRLRLPDRSSLDVSVVGLPERCTVTIGAGEPMPASAAWQGDDLVTTVSGETRRYRIARSGTEAWLARPGSEQRFVEIDRLDAETIAGSEHAVGAIRSPMPGTVIAVAVREGDSVAPGAALVTVEAMKMEHTLVAPAAAVVSGILVTAGAQVAMDEVLVVLDEQGESV